MFREVFSGGQSHRYDYNDPHDPDQQSRVLADPLPRQKYPLSFEHSHVVGKCLAVNFSPEHTHTGVE